MKIFQVLPYRSHSQTHTSTHQAQKLIIVDDEFIFIVIVRGDHPFAETKNLLVCHDETTGTSDTVSTFSSTFSTKQALKNYPLVILRSPHRLISYRGRLLHSSHSNNTLSLNDMKETTPKSKVVGGGGEVDFLEKLNVTFRFAFIFTILIFQKS